MSFRNTLLSVTAGFALVAAVDMISAQPASAGLVEIRFDNPLPGGGANPGPIFSFGLLTVTASCSISGGSATSCTLSQSAEGLGINSIPNADDPDRVDFVNGVRETLNFAFSELVNIVRVDFEVEPNQTAGETDTRVRLNGTLLSADSVNQILLTLGSGRVCGAAVDDGAQDTECEVSFANNLYGNLLTFTPETSSDGLFRVESITINVPEPMTLGLLGAGLVGLGAAAARRRR